MTGTARTGKGKEIAKMMGNELINVMTVDELRNYAAHQSELLCMAGDLLFARQELNDSLLRCVRNARYESEQNKFYDRKLNKLRNLEDVLMEEHYDELPHPTPCASGERMESVERI